MFYVKKFTVFNVKCQILKCWSNNFSYICLHIYNKQPGCIALGHNDGCFFCGSLLQFLRFCHIFSSINKRHNHFTNQQIILLSYLSPVTVIYWFEFPLVSSAASSCPVTPYSHHPLTLSSFISFETSLGIWDTIKSPEINNFQCVCWKSTHTMKIYRNQLFTNWCFD